MLLGFSKTTMNQTKYIGKFSPSVLKQYGIVLGIFICIAENDTNAIVFLYFYNVSDKNLGCKGQTLSKYSWQNIPEKLSNNERLIKIRPVEILKKINLQ